MSIYMFFVNVVEASILVHNYFADYFWNAFFLSEVEYLPYFRLVLSIILVYNWDDLGTKSVTLSVHQAIRRNSENLETEYWWWNISRLIRHTYNKERKLVPFVEKFLYKYFILGCYVQIQECYMSPLMLNFYF